LLLVSDEASALHDPGECSFDDPASADYDETLHAGHAPDDLKGDMGLVMRPCDQLSGVAAVDEDALDEGEAPPGFSQDTLRPVTVLEVGAVDFDREQPAAAGSLP
jgi:hypothetical protein